MKDKEKAVVRTKTKKEKSWENGKGDKRNGSPSIRHSPWLRLCIERHRCPFSIHGMQVRSCEPTSMCIEKWHAQKWKQGTIWITRDFDEIAVQDVPLLLEETFKRGSRINCRGVSCNLTPRFKVHNEIYLNGPEMECIRTMLGLCRWPLVYLSCTMIKYLCHREICCPAFVIESGRPRSSFGGDV